MLLQLISPAYFYLNVIIRKFIMAYIIGVSNSADIGRIWNRNVELERRGKKRLKMTVLEFVCALYVFACILGCVCVCVCVYATDTYIYIYMCVYIHCVKYSHFSMSLHSTSMGSTKDKNIREKFCICVNHLQSFFLPLFP
jgi:hypothetical protein